jgi:hypothetical protein
LSDWLSAARVRAKRYTVKNASSAYFHSPEHHGVGEMRVIWLSKNTDHAAISCCMAMQLWLFGLLPDRLRARLRDAGKLVHKLPKGIAGRCLPKRELFNRRLNRQEGAA